MGMSTKTGRLISKLLLDKPQSSGGGIGCEILLKNHLATHAIGRWRKTRKYLAKKYPDKDRTFSTTWPGWYSPNLTSA
jgi:hypothetical protein